MLELLLFTCVLYRSHMRAPTATQNSHLCTGSSGGMPEGKDPEMDSETARKKDPFFKEVDKRTK